MRKFYLLTILMLLGLCHTAYSQATDFDWGNATVYFGGLWQ